LARVVVRFAAVRTLGWRPGLRDVRAVASCGYVLFFFNDTTTTEIYTLSLHDALPISRPARSAGDRGSSAARTSCTARSSACTRSDRKSTRLNSSHSQISYAVFCLKKKKNKYRPSLFLSYASPEP